MISLRPGMLPHILIATLEAPDVPPNIVAHGTVFSKSCVLCPCLLNVDACQVFSFFLFQPWQYYSDWKLSQIAR